MDGQTDIADPEASEASSPYPPATPRRRNLDAFYRAVRPSRDPTEPAAGPSVRSPASASPEPARWLGAGSESGPDRDAHANVAGPAAQPSSEAPSALPPLWGEAPDGIGISLSGGGIRSASYCLGALQAMSRHNMLFGPSEGNPARAKYLSAVSGGSYIATAFATVSTAGVYPGDTSESWRNQAADVRVPPGGQVPNLSPFAPGTPEERFLRNRALYLTHGRGGVPAALWRLLLGILVNTTFIATLLATFALPLGWAYQAAWPSLRTGCDATCIVGARFSIPDALWIAVVASGAASLVAGVLWLLLRSGGGPAVGLGLGSGVLAVASLVLLGLFIALPELLHVLSFQPSPGAPSSVVSSNLGTRRATEGVTLGVGTAGLVGLIVTWMAAAKHILAMPVLGESGIAGKIAGFAARNRPLMMNVVATIAGPILVVIGIGALAWVGARYPIGWTSTPQRLATVGWAFSILVALYSLWQMDVTTWSLHPFYRRRLSAAFVLRRIALRAGMRSPTAVGDIDADERPYPISYLLSQFASKDFPELLVCASANISDYGATPTGSHVTSFVFSPRVVGGPLVGGVPTAEYEAAMNLAKRRHSAFATLPTAMALSAAAIAPSMGRMTITPYRFLMALANLRLGAWIPNPRRLAHFDGALVQPRPGPQYFVRELVGRNHLDAPFLYITDGGHYENLGLVELLRRKCKVVWCIDSSGDRIDTFNTFGGALRIAAAELGVTIDLNPEAMAPTSASPRYVAKPYARGTIAYPDGTTGSIVIVKAGVPENAPWSVRSYHLSHAQFPCDPTLDQLYDADRFEAYRELGYFCVNGALTCFGPDQSRDPS